MSVYTGDNVYVSKVGNHTCFIHHLSLKIVDIVVQGERHSRLWVSFVMGLLMAGNKAMLLYGSKAWKDTRKAYMQSVGGLCERCMASGIVVPAELVHHKVPLTEDNACDMSIALDWNNLQALCRKCHAEVHDEMYRERTGRRYKVDSFGRVIIV